jgi:neutral ceramidase
MRLFCLILLIGGLASHSSAQNSPVKSGQQTTDGLYAGVARTDITPPIGSRLAGHFYESLSTGIHDPLWAKALVLQQGNEKVSLVFCDLIGMTSDISVIARSRASARTGIPPENILIAATHSHTGPLYYGFQYDYFHQKALRLHGEDPHEKVNYGDFLVDKLVAVIVQAYGELGPVEVQVGVGRQEGISFNRRYHMKDGTVVFNPGPLNPDIVGPTGPIDPDVGILLLRHANTGEYKGGLTVFAMHADGVGGTKISADYPYYLAKTLKRKFGRNFISAFAVGPSGDINHVNVHKDDPIYSASQPRRFGTVLGRTVINEVSKLKTVMQPALALRSGRIALPLHVPRKTQIDSAKRMIHDLYEVRESGEYIARAGGESGNFLKRVEMSKYMSLEGKGESIMAEVQVLRIDAETAIVGLPGEIFVELGLSIKKRSPFKNTLIMSLCNEKMSYIPTEKAFTEGSYEVTNAIVKRGSGELLVNTAIELLKEIKK